VKRTSSQLAGGRKKKEHSATLAELPSIPTVARKREKEKRKAVAPSLLKGRGARVFGLPSGREGKREEEKKRKKTHRFLLDQEKKRGRRGRGRLSSPDFNPVPKRRGEKGRGGKEDFLQIPS